MRTLIKGFLCRLTRYLGLNALCYRSHRDDLLVLNYHGVVAENRRGAVTFGYHNTASLAEFESQLRLLKRYFNPVSAARVQAWACREALLPPHPVLLTFDDGYRNNFTYAAPLLKQYAVPAIIFLSTAYIGGDRLLWPNEIVESVRHWPRDYFPHPNGKDSVALGAQRERVAQQLCEEAKRFPMPHVFDYLAELRRDVVIPAQVRHSYLHAFLTWEQVRELHRDGMEFGSHTVEHVICTGCASDHLRRELADSKHRIEAELQAPCTSFAYPNGSHLDWAPWVAEMLRQVGYRCAYWLPDDFQPPSPDAFALRRVAIPGHLDPCLFEARVFGSLILLARFLGGRERPGASP